jgi:hypothetical protein
MARDIALPMVRRERGTLSGNFSDESLIPDTFQTQLEI